MPKCFTCLRRVAVLVGKAASASPYGGAPWGEVLAHIAQRLQWTDGSFEMLVFNEAEFAGEGIYFINIHGMYNSYYMSHV